MWADRVEKKGNGKSRKAVAESFLLSAAGGRTIDVDPPLLGFAKVESIKHSLDQMKIRNITEGEALRTIRGNIPRAMVLTGA
jgi:hypothetical protein